MPEYTIADMMSAHSEDAVDLARDRFQVELDYSEESLQQVEAVLDELHRSIPTGLFGRLLRRGPSDEQLEQMAKIWGGYLGEVIRRRWGGTWSDQSAQQPGRVLTLNVRGSEIYPPARIYRRLKEGPENNVWDYYRVLRATFQNEAPAQSQTPTE